MKTCSKCGIEKALSDFSTDKKSKDGKHYWCRGCISIASAKWAKDNPEVFKNYQLKRKYGISLEKYNEMYTTQNGCCAICGEHQDAFSRSLAVDHCHETEEVRGLLCTNCNTAIGKFKDDVSIVLKAVAYLTNPPNRAKD